MNSNEILKVPSKKERHTIRLMILLGVFSIVNFFFWFLKPNLIDDPILYWLLIIAILFDSFRIIYIWYHYWSINAPEKPKSSFSYTVDIFTTYFPGEPYEMVKETLLAIQKIRYPHTTYLCDEANDDHLKNFCKKNNIIHVTRTNRIDAKAGNINNALLQAKGEICLILDPDHVPKETILDELVPYFIDDKIGFVQSVQAYYNVSESLVARGAAEQTFHFYGPVMMSMNSYGTVNAIGANCLFRRKALDSIGGHAAGLSEDMHTAMQLHAKGWKSVYVPKVLTKGLVPASLTAYYKQQLKWSRGTLELLVSVYPKLFSRFSRRQKIHYGILPLHYLSGLIYLISFLIPIISLFSATTPWKGNIINFGLLYLPVFVSILGIRFYIQHWVMHKSERGVHLTGGLLQNGTWWIFLTGFIYTVIRKKVPYLPTPKENMEQTSWKILIPNLIVGVVSIVAVIYGLSIDYTPFSLLMSGFALLNAIFMFYTLIFAYQKPKVVTLNFNAKNKPPSLTNRIQEICFQFWRRTALPAMIVVLFGTILFQQYRENLKWEKVTPPKQYKNIITYFGIFDPKSDTGITDLKNAKDAAENIGVNFDIISIYLPWSRDVEADFPQSLIDSIYIQHSIPMITWEPWLNSFKNEIENNKHVFDLIIDGHFDDFVTRFSEKLKILNRPVFIRFAHEFDNPFYPWYVNDSTASLQFKKAWIHVYELFKKNTANNVIWIWNPWKPENVSAFYPGIEYVDWIGVNILNYGQKKPEVLSFEFDTLYLPFHNEFKMLPQTPVIVSEFGTVKDNTNQSEWISDAFNSIENNFTEIKSVVYFNSRFDNNIPGDFSEDEFLDWKIPENQAFDYSFIAGEVPHYVFSTLPNLKIDLNKAGNAFVANNNVKNINGINLKKGHDWRKDYHVLSRKNLVVDFENIKKLGINTIKFEGNSVYDDNVVNISDEFDLDVSYGFWIPAYIDFVNDSVVLKQLETNILKKIRKIKHRSNITSWNIQNDVLFIQKDFYHKPELLFQNGAYINWLKNLAKKIKEIDKERPLIVDVEINKQSIYFSKLLLANVMEIDVLGLVVKDDKYLEPFISFLEQTKINYIFSDIDVPDLVTHNLIRANQSFFITAWQDQHEKNKLTFDGIIDRKGRFKSDYIKLQNAISSSSLKPEIPKIRILKPAVLLYEDMKLEYYAMSYDDLNGWKYAEVRKDLNFEWSLVKCDLYGNYLAIKDIGSGPKIIVEIPSDYDYYRLLLTTLKGETIVNSTITRLNTPLIQKNNTVK